MVPLAAWENFFVAQVGASAALAGLLFVGISINMTRILQFPVLVLRAMQALILLVTILILGSLTLVPVATSTSLGIEVVGVGAIAFAALALLVRRVLQRTERQYRRGRLVDVAMCLGASSLYVAGGATLALVGLAGLYLVVPGILLSYTEAILSSWVLLVEVNR
ncbi:MAG TPA: hypothetical protein VEL82_04430 [Thermoplasmata archaeon]|nr:hypothetical protein [Thermoplasmata archaeon]